MNLTGVELVVNIFVFMLGAVVGSFLNVCIVRLPEEKSVVFPSSHCVHCKKAIHWYDNIPIFSYIQLKGKCRFCQQSISIRYPIVELVTAASFVLFYQYFGLQWVVLPYLIFHCGLIVATFVDIKHRIIPDEISLGGMVVGLIFSALIPQLHGTDSLLISLWRSFLGILIGGGSIYAMGMLGDFLFKKESMGGGDVKLLGMVGAFLGWKMAVLAFFIAPFFGAIAGIIVKIRTKDSVIAYGPFLSLGALICLFYGQQIMQWILLHYGIAD